MNILIESFYKEVEKLRDAAIQVVILTIQVVHSDAAIQVVMLTILMIIKVL